MSSTPLLFDDSEEEERMWQEIMAGNPTWIGDPIDIVDPFEESSKPSAGDILSEFLVFKPYPTTQETARILEAEFVTTQEILADVPKPPVVRKYYQLGLLSLYVSNQDGNVTVDLEGACVSSMSMTVSETLNLLRFMLSRKCLEFRDSTDEEPIRKRPKNMMDEETKNVTKLGPGLCVYWIERIGGKLLRVLRHTETEVVRVLFINKKSVTEVQKKGVLPLILSIGADYQTTLMDLPLDFWTNMRTRNMSMQDYSFNLVDSLIKFPDFSWRKVISKFG